MLTSVRLDAKTEAVLRRLARRTGRTKSQVLRDAIARLAEAELEPGASFLAMVSDLVDVTVSGPADLARRSEEVFRERPRGGRPRAR